MDIPVVKDIIDTMTDAKDCRLDIGNGDIALGTIQGNSFSPDQNGPDIQILGRVSPTNDIGPSLVGLQGAITRLQEEANYAVELWVCVRLKHPN